MKRIITNKKWLIAILFVALLVRIIYFIYEKPYVNNYLESGLGKGDSEEYHNLAKMILENGSFPENVYLDTYRTPVFPLFVAVIYLVFGMNPYVVLLSNILLNLISVIYLYLICEKIFNNETISLIASSLLALEPNFIKLTNEFGTETLHTTLLIISIYYLITGLNDNKKIYISISGIFFAITALTRPISLYFYIPCILFILFFPNLERKFKFSYVILFVLFYLLSITPWMYRNYKAYGYLSTNTFQGNTLMYLAGITAHFEKGIPVDSCFKGNEDKLNKICEEKNIKNPFEIDKQKQILGFNYLIRHLDIYIPLHLKGMIKYFIAPLNNDNYSMISKFIFASYFLFIYSFFFIGSYGFIKEKKLFYLTSFLIGIFYFCFLTGAIGRARYRLPATVFYLILSAYGIWYVLDIFSKSKKLNIERISKK